MERFSSVGTGTCNALAVDPELLDFNHDYTFTIIVYAFVFMLWYIWIQRFSPLGNTAEA